MLDPDTSLASDALNVPPQGVTITFGRSGETIVGHIHVGLAVNQFETLAGMLVFFEQTKSASRAFALLASPARARTGGAS